MSNELVIERTYNAPRELVYKAWTKAEHLAQWWGPKGFNIEVHKFELRPGGIFHYCMRADNGAEMWGRFTYEEITAPERIIFVNSFSDRDGNITRGPFFDGKWPQEIRNVVTLTEENGKTTVTIKGQPINATIEEHTLFAGMAENMLQGFKGTFDKLEDHLAIMVQNLN